MVGNFRHRLVRSICYYMILYYSKLLHKHLTGLSMEKKVGILAEPQQYGSALMVFSECCTVSVNFRKVRSHKAGRPCGKL